MDILIVDDSKVMRLMIIKTLEMTGLFIKAIHQAADGQEGLDILRNQPIDLVIVDINMPVMNGEEMIDRMQADEMMKKISIIIISTEGSEKRIDRLIQKGVRFIHKPFSPESVRDMINDMTKTGADDV